MKKILVIAFTMVVLAVSVLGLFNEPQEVEALGNFVDSNRGAAFYYKNKDNVGQINEWTDFAVGESFYAIIITNAVHNGGANQTFDRRFVYSDFGAEPKNSLGVKYGHLDRANSTEGDCLSHAIWRFQRVGTRDSAAVYEIFSARNGNFSLDANPGGYAHLYSTTAGNPENRHWAVHPKTGYGENAVLLASLSNGKLLRVGSSSQHDNYHLYIEDGKNMDESRGIFHIFPLIQNSASATYGTLGADELTSTISVMSTGQNITTRTDLDAAHGDGNFHAIGIYDPNKHNSPQGMLWKFVNQAKSNDTTQQKKRALCTWRIEDYKGFVLNST